MKLKIGLSRIQERIASWVKPTIRKKINGEVNDFARPLNQFLTENIFDLVIEINANKFADWLGAELDRIYDVDKSIEITNSNSRYFYDGWTVYLPDDYYPHLCFDLHGSEFVPGDTSSLGESEIIICVEIQELSENCVRVICDCIDIPSIIEYANHLHDSVLKTFDRMIVSKSIKAEYPPGRPRNEDDDWAWEQVRMKSRLPSDIYPEWLERIGKRANILANPRDSFNKAISPQRRKKMEKTD